MPACLLQPLGKITQLSFLPDCSCTENTLITLNWLQDLFIFIQQTSEIYTVFYVFLLLCLFSFRSNKALRQNIELGRAWQHGQGHGGRRQGHCRCSRGLAVPRGHILICKLHNKATQYVPRRSCTYRHRTEILLFFSSNPFSLFITCFGQVHQHHWLTELKDAFHTAGELSRKFRRRIAGWFDQGRNVGKKTSHCRKDHLSRTTRSFSCVKGA